jgi:hypothetical protein
VLLTWIYIVTITYAIKPGLSGTLLSMGKSLILRVTHKLGCRILTTQKMIKAAGILAIPIYATTQNRNRLGETCPELEIPSAVVHVDKTAFSMCVPELMSKFSSTTPAEIVIVGIESHICVTQTTLDLLAEGHKVYVLADGVSSCNPQEVPIALARLRAAGAVVTTSESFLYECMGDAGIPE